MTNYVRLAVVQTPASSGQMSAGLSDLISFILARLSNCLCVPPFFIKREPRAAAC